MYVLAKQLLTISISILLFSLTQPLSGSSKHWNGTTNDLTLASGSDGNWSFSLTPPGLTDTAFFGIQLGSKTPSLTPASVSPSFTPQLVFFEHASSEPTYSFTIDNQNTSAGINMSVGDGINTGTGVSNQTNGHVVESFQILGGAIMTFTPLSSALLPTVFGGSATYAVLSNSPTYSSQLIFNGAFASNVTIGVNNNASYTQPSSLIFGNTAGASAQTCTIDAQNSALVTFNNNADAASSTISLRSGSNLTFTQTSTITSAFITLDNSTLTYNSSVTLSTGVALLTNGANALITTNLSLNRITSDSTSSINIGANTLTIVNPNDNDALAGVISGTTGSLIKKGSNQLFMTNSSNSYSGGTTVTAGKLTVTPQSLPTPSVVVQASSTLNFIGSGTFSGPISDSGGIEASSGASVTLAGSITGPGILTVDAGANLSLGAANSYSGGTFISGNLNTNPAYLPGTYVVNVLAPAGSLNFFGSGSYTGNISNNGSVTTTSGASVTLSGLISGPGLVSVGAGSDLTLTYITNTYGGGTFISGNLHAPIASLPVGGAITTNAPNGDLDLLGSGTYPGNITDNGNVSTATSGNITLSGTLSGSGAVTMNGTGTLTLNGPNTYSGGTFINAGAIIASTSTLPVATVQPSVTVAGTGALNLVQPSAGTYIGNIALTTATANINISGAGPLTLTGAITGLGELNVTSGTTTLLNPGNSYSGTTVIASGATLQGNSSSLQGAIFNNSNLIFNQTSSGMFNGTIVGPSSATNTINGPGFLSIASPQAGFNGTTNIQGALLLNNILGGNVNVLTTGFLGGNATILGNLVNSGTVSPGNNSIGLMNVGGNYIQTASGTYFVEINNTGNADLLNVAGTATLNGTLLIDVLNGVTSPTTVYTILHANGGVINQFSNVAMLGLPLFTPTVLYLPNDVQITFQSVFIPVAETFNQMQVANQLATLNQSNATPDELPLLTELLSLSSNPQTVDSARAALSQMSGEQYSNHMFTAELIGRRFIRQLYDPLRSIIVNGSTCAEKDTYYKCYQCDGCVVIDGSPWFPEPHFQISQWLSISGGHTFMRHNANASGFKSNNYEVSTGIQSTFAETWTLGIAGGYEYDHLSYNIGGHGNFNTGLFGLYSLWRPAGFYLLSDLAFDYSWGNVKRPINVGTLSYQARSKPVFTETTFYIEAGKDICWFDSGLLLQPFLGIEVDYYAARSFIEKHAEPINLKVNNKDRTNAFSRLGIHLNSLSLNCWTLSCDIAWLYRMTNTQNRLTENFQEFGSSFYIKGVPVPRNSIDFSAYVSKIFNDSYEIFAEVSGERWARGGTYDFLAGVKFSW